MHLAKAPLAAVGFLSRDSNAPWKQQIPTPEGPRWAAPAAAGESGARIFAADLLVPFRRIRKVARRQRNADAYSHRQRRAASCSAKASNNAIERRGKVGRRGGDGRRGRAETRSIRGGPNCRSLLRAGLLPTLPKRISFRWLVAIFCRRVARWRSTVSSHQLAAPRLSRQTLLTIITCRTIQIVYLPRRSWSCSDSRLHTGYMLGQQALQGSGTSSGRCAGLSRPPVCRR